MPYRLSDHGEHHDWGGGGPGREVLAAWLLAILLLCGAVVSFALDQMVTVSPDPVATYGSALKADEGDGPDGRELKDSQP